MLNKLIEKQKNLAGSSSVERLEIPKHLPPVVRDVAESLALRDRDSAKRYIEAHQEQKKRD
jgi:hypothetical protein